MNDEEKKPQDENTVVPLPANEEDENVTLPVLTDEDETPQEEITEIDIAPTSDISTVDENLADDPDAQEEISTSVQQDDTQEETSSTHSHGDIPLTWIEIVDGKFKCSECDNEVEAETNTIEGVVKADLDQIKADLELYPTKVIYGICPVCGMEFVFRQQDDKLYLEPSDLEK